MRFIRRVICLWSVASVPYRMNTETALGKFLSYDPPKCSYSISAPSILLHCSSPVVMQQKERRMESSILVNAAAVYRFFLWWFIYLFSVVDQIMLWSVVMCSRSVWFGRGGIKYKPCVLFYSLDYSTIDETRRRRFFAFSSCPMSNVHNVIKWWDDIMAWWWSFFYDIVFFFFLVLYRRCAILEGSFVSGRRSGGTRERWKTPPTPLDERIRAWRTSG